MMLLLLQLLTLHQPRDTAFSWTLQSRVHSLNFTCVRTNPTVASACFATHQCCDKGTITAGPTLDATVTFWRVQFDTGSSGWARQTNLALDTLFKPTPPPPPVASGAAFLPIWPTNLLQQLGDSIQWLVSAFDSSGKQFLTLPCTVGWQSSNPQVATIRPDGGEVSVGVGTAFITATCGAISKRAMVTVAARQAPPPPVSLTVKTFTIITSNGSFVVQLPYSIIILTGNYEVRVADSTGKQLTTGGLNLMRP